MQRSLIIIGPMIILGCGGDAPSRESASQSIADGCAACEEDSNVTTDAANSSLPEPDASDEALGDADGGANELASASSETDEANPGTSVSGNDESSPTDGVESLFGSSGAGAGGAPNFDASGGAGGSGTADIREQSAGGVSSVEPGSEDGPGGIGNVADDSYDCDFPSVEPPGESSFVAMEFSAELSVSEVLEAMQELMIGSWRGVASPPSGWTQPDYEVDITFEATGTYEAHCSSVDQDCCLSFYYGTDQVYPERARRFFLDGLSRDGSANGSIEVLFDYDGEPDLPAWDGLLLGVQVDTSGDLLRFNFETSSGYGPIHYYLARLANSE